MREQKNLIRRMRLTMLIFAVTATLTSFPAAAQESPVTLPAKKITAQEVFESIQKQTPYLIAVNAQQTAGLSVNVEPTPLSVKELLERLFEGSGLTYRLDGNYIIITPLPAESPTAASAVASAADYPRNAPGAVSAAPVVRPVREVPPPVVPLPAIVPAGDTIPSPAAYSAYKPIDTFAHVQSATPRFAIKTNLLYTAATFTPNLAFEFALNRKSTLEISGGYNWMGRTAAASDNHKQRVHMILRPEYRWWLCERYNGHFFGAHAIYARYNVSGYDVPLLFDRENRYDGHAYGAGASYGYHWAFAKRWGAEFNLGLGYVYMDYEQYGCAKCDRIGTPRTKHYFGPTRAGVTLVFMLK